MTSAQEWQPLGNFCAYVILDHCNQSSSPIYRYNCLKKTVPDANEEARIGNPGLRKSWESFEAYKEKLRKNGVYKNGFLTDKQVILCPLLGRCREQLDQFIRSNPEAGNPLLKYCGLTAGICAFDNAVVKVGRRQEPTVHHLPDPVNPQSTRTNQVLSIII